MKTLAILLVMAQQPPDFDTEVLPVLTRAGCNSGACHGAAAGRGGLKLSLFGGNPQADHRAIALDLEGRRGNLAFPEKILIQKKQVGELDHEGGVRLEATTAATELITRWIADGARREEQRR